MKNDLKQNVILGKNVAVIAPGIMLTNVGESTVRYIKNGDTYRFEKAKK